MTQRLLQPAFMIKRSRNKGRFKSSNFKSRWFVLTKDNLTYHDGGANVSISLQVSLTFCVCCVTHHGWRDRYCQIQTCHFKSYHFIIFGLKLHVLQSE